MGEGHSVAQLSYVLRGLSNLQRIFSQYELDRYDADRAANVSKTWTWDPVSDDQSAEIFNDLHP